MSDDPIMTRDQLDAIAAKLKGQTVHLAMHGFGVHATHVACGLNPAGWSRELWTLLPEKVTCQACRDVQRSEERSPRG